MANTQRNLDPVDDGSASSSTSWRLFSSPEDTWEAMLEDCRNARSSIEFEQYILENDPVGQRFIQLFIEKAKAGVDVFLLCDKFGSATLRGSSLAKALVHAGGTLRYYHKLRVGDAFRPWRWFPRTHVKTLLIDKQIAYVGGVCIAERMKGWRDTHIRVIGPVSAQLATAFAELKARSKKRALLTQSAAAVQEHLARSVETQPFTFLENKPRLFKYDVYNVLRAAMLRAEKYIYITTPFFVPHIRFMGLLRWAKRHGVEVRLLVPRRSDVVLADYACLSYTPRLLRAGVRIFHYQPTVIHGKTVIVDDRWATVGSTNMDVISFFYNRESNIIITETDAIAALKAQFEQDLQRSVEMTWEGWRRVPVWKKALGVFARSLRLFFRK